MNNQSIFKKGFKYRIYPTTEQQVFLDKTFGCCRKVWNVLLDESCKQYQLYLQGKTEKPKVSPYDFALKLTQLKQREGFEYLNEVSSKALQIASHRLGSAFQNFFKKKSGYPRFKAKNKNSDTFTLESSTVKYFSVKYQKFTIAKLKAPIRVSWDRELPSDPTQVTIYKDPSGKYFASFLCEVPGKPTNGQGSVGIDLGINTLATMSDGTTIENPRHYVKAQRRLVLLQRRLSKKVKGSKNREKARIKVAVIHEKIRNQRLDYLHKFSRKLVDENQAIVIEDLNVKGMSGNRKLAKHILDGGFGMFRRMLTYKVIESAWCRLIVADRWYPSTQLCHVCHSRSKTKIDLKTRSWTCGSCLTLHDRDANASRNLSWLADLVKVKYPDIWNKGQGSIILTNQYKDLIPV